MTSSLAVMENQLSEQFRSAGLDDSSPGHDSDSDSQQTVGQFARRLQRRSTTVEDVLKAPVETGNIEAIEVNEQLLQFVEESEFLQQLAATRDVADNILEAAGTDADPQHRADDTVAAAHGDKAYQRAVEYAAAARFLDDLYRRLLTPRLAQLRRIEQRASELAQQRSNSGGGSGNQEITEDDPETQTGVRMLRQELEALGLADLSELLSEIETPDETIIAALEAQFGSAATTEMAGQAGDGQSGVGDLGDGAGIGIGSGGLDGRLYLVVAGLRTRIQEMILLEISADRDAPVPVRYRRSVDGYFRTLAGDAVGVDSVRVEAEQRGATSAGTGGSQ